MPENAVHNYSDTCSRLGAEIQELAVNIRVGEQNKKLQIGRASCRERV